MSQPVGLDCVEALVIEHGFDQAIGRGIAIRRCHEIGAEGFANRGNIVERIGVSLPDQFARDRGVIEALGQAMDDACLQRIVVQDGRVDEGRELWLATYDILRLAEDPCPDRIDLIQCRPCLMLRHRSVSRIPAYVLSYRRRECPKPTATLLWATRL